MSATPTPPTPDPELPEPVLALGSRLRRARLALYDAGLRVPLSWIRVGEDGRLVFDDLTGRAAEEFLRFLERVGDDVDAPVVAPVDAATLFDDGWFDLPTVGELIVGGAR